jgi:hypothetical protein
MLFAKPIGFKQACEFVAALHRHHKPPQGHKFSISAAVKGRVVGVVMVGRPVARKLDDGVTAEVIRLCTDGTENACSFLYSCAARAAQAMGYNSIVTYILSSETGASLRASGWTDEGQSGGGSWSRDARGREDKHPLETKRRYRRWLAKWA